MKPINVLSLFDGMSCGQIALERTNIPVENYFASEIEKSSILVTKTNYPKTIHVGDVRLLKKENFPEIDLLIGGSPCQSFSFEGKRNGMSTKENIEVTSLEQYLELKQKKFEFKGQSYLFWEYARILKEVNPKLFLLENVKMVKKWKDIISKTLGVEPIEINSSLVSAQNRKRLYWTNISEKIEQPKDKELYFRDIFDKDESSYSFWKPDQMEKWFRKEYVRKDYYRIEQKDNKVQCLMAFFGHNHPKTWYEENKLFRRLTRLEFERLQTVPEGYTLSVSNRKAFQMLGNGWTVDIIAHIFNYIK